MSLWKKQSIPFMVVGADGRMVVPPGAKLIPCPECSSETGHTASCSLSTHVTGVYWLCIALPINLMRTDAGSKVAEAETEVLRR